MFKEIIGNEKMMNLVNWLLCHPDKEYSAMVIGMATGLKSPSQFVHYLVILDECGVVNVRQDREEMILYVSLNRNSALTQAFADIRDLIEEKIASSELAMDAIERVKFSDELSGIELSDIKEALDDDDKEEIINKIKNYEDLDEDNPSEFFIKSRIAKIDAEGNLENFISFIENL